MDNESVISVNREELEKTLNVLKDLGVQLEESQAKNKLLQEQFQYLAADFANYKRRVDHEKQLLVNDIKRKMILDELTVLDNFERYIKHDQANPSHNKKDEGIIIMYNNLLSIIQSYGCVRISPQTGDDFNTDIHDAVQINIIQENSNNKPNTIASVLQDGWIMDDVLIRPAKVIVWS